MKEKGLPNSLGLLAQGCLTEHPSADWPLPRRQKILESAGWLEYSLLQASPVANYFAGVFLLKQCERHE
jgi:hypothetical protein